jgi:hypothetical protein
VSWLPGQILDRNSAITAMILADLVGEEDLYQGHRLWPHVQGWAAELGLTGPEAVAAASQPPGDINREHEQAGRQPAAARPGRDRHPADQDRGLDHAASRHPAHLPWGKCPAFTNEYPASPD